MANFSLFGTGFGSCQRESVLSVLCHCCHLGLNRPLFLDYIGLLSNVWMTVDDIPLISEFYFWLRFFPISNGSLSSVSEFLPLILLLLAWISECSCHYLRRFSLTSNWTHCLFTTSFLLPIFFDSDFSWFLSSLSNELWAEGLTVLFIFLFLHFSSNSWINFYAFITYLFVIT